MSDEVFHAGNGAPANFNTGTLKVSVNGSVAYASYNTGNMSLGQVVDSIARTKGIRTFSLYGDGRKLNTDDAKQPASSFKEIDIVAKDSRG